MTKKSEYLVAYGFAKGKSIQIGNTKIDIKGDTPAKKLHFIREKRKELAAQGKDKEFDDKLQELADHSWQELASNQMVLTDYPKSEGHVYTVSLESWHQSIENYYYWCLNFFSDIGFPIVDKITDTFAAAEHSSFYGAAAQRLGLSQDKVGQYLATIGKMVKDLFALVRELRWIDERLAIYRDALGIDKDGKPKKDKDGKPTGPLQGAEIALKGMWVDLVDGVVGGQRTGSNLFNMAAQLQFVALPDLFFSIHPKERADVDKIVEEQAGQFNQQVKNVLKRKLEQYLAWKEATFREITQRRTFTLDYLAQHYNSIKLYMTWVKPYIKHIQRLTGQMDLMENARLISSFESNLIEIEVIARTKPKGSKNTYTCIMLTLEYHSKPQMQFQGDAGYHRGPLHVGTTRITWRAYAWTDEQIKNYKAMRAQEDIDLIASIDKNLQSALDQLGGDIANYIEEAERYNKEPVKKEPEKPQANILEPFTALVSGIKETFGSLIPTLPKFSAKKSSDGKDNLGPHPKMMCFLHYSVFKKAHGLLSW